ncbi:hypothetical protein [Methylorubrum extorquens]
MKINLALAISVALIWIGQAQAQSIRQTRQPTAASTQGLCEQPAPEERAQVPGEAERAAAQARMETFYRRLDDRAERAARSICDGCWEGRAYGAKLWHLKASAKQPETVVDDPAQAPEF